MAVQKFWVRGLAHEGEALLEERVRGVPGVLFVSANHQEESAEIEFDDDVASLDGLRGAIEGLGYVAELAG
jgi:copper chaperone CopZ